MMDSTTSHAGSTYLEALRMVESAFQHTRPDLMEIFLEVRSIALGIKPHASERIRSSGITLFDARKGGTITGGICFVDFRDNLVQVRFGRGSFLDDPKSLLSGKQKYMRHINLYSFDEVPWEDLEQLIKDSAEFDEALVRATYTH